MNSWTLEIRRDIAATQLPACIDARRIKLSEFSFMSEPQICKVELSAGSELICIGDLFTVSKAADNLTLRLIGDLSSFHFIGYQHDGGQLIVEGNVGDYAGSRMSRGEFWVAGSTGDFLAAATGTQRVGMSGGRIVVTGSVGHHAGHRMRRGAIMVNGSATDFLGSHMIAGTILVAERAGQNVGYAMQRGTLLLGHLPILSKNRFSAPTGFHTAFFLLLSKQWNLEDWQKRLPKLSSSLIELDKIKSLLAIFAKGPFCSCRGDFAVAGQGEIIWPNNQTSPIPLE
ncbi:Formyltransferase/hydrolase complex Fhc subunit C [Novipirellula aureliae]|uniref:Formyltransferase/hydrolase complex Fhc subunit C n=1 Tax=Novipirellula aureliae TaxID=2527966 RepID=A0A5C6E8U8_9BACT|nr:formylmethanofuran dehydrogenase subunit C [Novipirellula aureliae]TWU44965.1 Formyltransferase/hydrolase complex Fhc subunit C [Novipirellula aureliae]